MSESMARDKFWSEYARKMGAKVIDFPEQSGNGVGGATNGAGDGSSPSVAKSRESYPNNHPADSETLCAQCGKPFETNHPPAYWRGLLFHRPHCQMEFLKANAQNINHQTGTFTPAEGEQYRGIRVEKE